MGLALAGLVHHLQGWQSGWLAAVKSVGLCHHTRQAHRSFRREASADICLLVVRLVYTAVRLSAQKLSTADP